jgi:hypothetical protein
MAISYGLIYFRERKGRASFAQVTAGVCTKLAKRTISFSTIISSGPASLKILYVQPSEISCDQTRPAKLLGLILLLRRRSLWLSRIVNAGMDHPVIFDSENRRKG